MILQAPLRVLKFGGTSVADVERIRKSSAHVLREVKAGHRAAVVVSAMAGATNTLVAQVREAAPLPELAEYDAVVAAGEQVSAGLMALVLQQAGVKARSFQGWQVPIRTSDAYGAAPIQSVGTAALTAFMDEGGVPVITGFQGVSAAGRIATLGRGGSDTSAVAVAAALGAARCDIYTDVDGVYTCDPRLEPRARRIARIGFEEMLEMASLGAKVLHVRAVEMAMLRRLPLLVRSSFDGPDAPERGTLVSEEDEMSMDRVVNSIAVTQDEAKISVLGLADQAGLAARVFVPLAEAGINVDVIVQNASADGKTADITFTVGKADYERATHLLQSSKAQLGYRELRGDTNVAKISCIGAGMRTHTGVAANLFRALADQKINIQAISTSEIKISVLVEAHHAPLAARTLHSLYGLDRE